MSKSFAVVRSLEIEALPEQIFPLLNDFHAWAKWSPYEQMDPSMQKHYGEVAVGVGAKYAWVGKKTGSGDMEIMSVSAPTELKINLNFTRPMKASNQVIFTLRQQGDATQVTWLMTGKQSWLMRVAGVFVNFDRMIGKDFEVGLKNLQSIVEAKS